MSVRDIVNLRNLNVCSNIVEGTQHFYQSPCRYCNILTFIILFTVLLKFREDLLAVTNQLRQL